VFLDYQNKRMIFEPNATMHDAFEADMSGMLLRLDDSLTTIAVETVAAGSPAAEAGIIPGDEIVSADGVAGSQKLLGELREFGVKIYLDDFGCGYSSLSHLHKLPVDALKIDRSFVKSLLLPDRPAIVESILALARTMNTSVVAEGIEDEVQARELERLGCTHAQGHLFSRPLATRAVEELLGANCRLGPKKVQASERVDATGNPPDVHYSGASFEWPKEWLQSA